MQRMNIRTLVIYGIVCPLMFGEMTAVAQTKTTKKSPSDKGTIEPKNSKKSASAQVNASKGGLQKTAPVKTTAPIKTVSPAVSPAVKKVSKPSQAKVKTTTTAGVTRTQKMSKPQSSAEPSQENDALRAEVEALKRELTTSGLIGSKEPTLTKEDAEQKATLETERDAAQKQLDSLNKAVEGGLDRSLVAGNIAKLRADIGDLTAKIEAIKPKSEPLELEKMKQEILALKASAAQLEKEKTTPPPAPIPAPVVPKPEPKPKTAGYDNGFFIQSEDGDFLMKNNGLIQLRFTYTNTDDGDERTNEYGFSVNRAELKFTGHAFSKRFQYAFQTEFGKGQVVIKDAYADIELVKNALVLRAGQWKRPYSRQYLVGEPALELVDRDDTVKQFGADRDIGFGFHNYFQKSPLFEYAIGVFNGTGYAPWMKGEASVETDDQGNQTADLTKCCSFTNVPSRFSPTLVTRIGFNLRDIKGYSEADLEGGPLRFAMAASVHVEFDGDDDNVSRVRAETDYMLKAYGFSTTGAVYIASKADGNLQHGDFEAVGYHFQLGHVCKGLVEPSLRYAGTIPDNDSGDPSAHRLLLGFSLYFKKHNLKWQTDGGPTFTEGDGETLVDGAVRTQMQLTF
jgi:hypothetical protein